LSLVLVSVVATLLGVATLATDRFGLLGLAVFVAVLVGGFAGVSFLSDSSWRRLTGENTAPHEIGQLHREGVALRKRLPWLPDLGNEDELAAYKADVEDWATRTNDALPERWKGVFMSHAGSFQTRMIGYYEASICRNWLDHRLERLSQIMVAIGGTK
jgi:hypothetical protein